MGNDQAGEAGLAPTGAFSLLSLSHSGAREVGEKSYFNSEVQLGQRCALTGIAVAQ